MEMQYRPLDRSSNEIRLLRLLPEKDRHDGGRFKRLPSCQVFYARLGAKPQYVALSYVWGTCQDKRVILVDGQQVKVSQTLYDAMMELRRGRRQHLIIWIDFLCINQRDHEEKSWQVALMGDIYRQATQVYAWLGPAEDDSDDIVDHLNKLGERAESCGVYTLEGVHHDIWRSLVAQGRQGHPPICAVTTEDNQLRFVSREELENLFYLMSGWREQDHLLPVAGIKRFFTRFWWGRIWMLQEMALPENAELLCGSKRISRRRCNAAISAYGALWATFMEKIQKGDTTSLTRQQLLFTTELFHHRPSVMLSLWRIYRYERFPLAALLRATCVGTSNLRWHGPHHFESTDPRDKVFALLSLASDREDLRQSGIIPDYTKTCAEVYTSVMLALLRQGHISFLSCCQIPKLQPGLPSWVPDWSQSFVGMLQDVENDHVTLYPKFGASGVDRGVPMISVPTINQVTQGLLLTCRVYDTIEAAGHFPRRKSSNEVPLSETFSWPSEWLFEILHLTYHRERSYENFRYRLCAAAVSSIAGAGYSDGKQTRMEGEDRLSDAVLLLEAGIRFLRSGDYRIKREVQKFLASGVVKAARESLERRKIRSQRLGPEIIGKSLGRLPFVTSTGHLVLSSEHVRKGDVVALIKGAQVPFILRREENSAYKLISEAYVHGIMDGEAAEEDKFGTVELV
ncbi:hypothetical protein AYO21_09900 [Fonsecaea monophora]|uniref:Heterokaryon incompatibility domain-containing protein n=1 Tax=Fonsecaea monophora TaxID=254056 RepID=A0A177EVC5_9EURO|nr:hypothetical protein AYO21_09900 [Fonsecaea monophora]KAH0843862.1 hypothetical protein FOPE_08605 [Fonsecaea pedrosoi]OAG35898.1 hypothetical protein AYO21_09900 [Fonsecaea monophora]